MIHLHAPCNHCPGHEEQHEWRPNALPKDHQFDRSLIEEQWTCPAPGGYWLWSACWLSRKEEISNIYSIQGSLRKKKHRHQTHTSPSSLIDLQWEPSVCGFFRYKYIYIYIYKNDYKLSLTFGSVTIKIKDMRKNLEILKTRFLKIQKVNFQQKSENSKNTKSQFSMF